MADIPEISYNQGNKMSIYFNPAWSRYAEGHYTLSPNRNFTLFIGEYYTDNSTDSYEILAVIRGNEIVHKKKLSEYSYRSDDDLCYIDDEGGCIYCTEENHVVFLDPTGKQKSKKTIPNLSSTYGNHSAIVDGYLYALVSNDEENSFLYVLDLESLKLSHYAVPDYEVEDEAGRINWFTGEYADLYYHDQKITLAYRDGKTCITIGFDGTIRDPSSEERAKAFEIQSMRISAEKREKEIFLNKQPEEKGFLKKLKNLFHKT